ncbi:hypothetical protein KIPB_003186 [Kipferlia bialata]|uniref:Uncharacterized protein n=1 Tax=Kipferlia bialata TaxID=797122 RepID=A0A9K3CTP2_9EUKA|nr:hypothetical protein KIPB_003186 [Kipferlia bialata]|eukprot:g3186.t1
MPEAYVHTWLSTLGFGFGAVQSCHDVIMIRDDLFVCVKSKGSRSHHGSLVLWFETEEGTPCTYSEWISSGRSVTQPVKVESDLIRKAGKQGRPKHAKSGGVCIRFVYQGSDHYSSATITNHLVRVRDVTLNIVPLTALTLSTLPPECTP